MSGGGRRPRYQDLQLHEQDLIMCTEEFPTMDVREKNLRRIFRHHQKAFVQQCSQRDCPRDNPVKMFSREDFCEKGFCVGIMLCLRFCELILLDNIFMAGAFL